MDTFVPRSASGGLRSSSLASASPARCASPTGTTSSTIPRSWRYAASTRLPRIIMSRARCGPATTAQTAAPPSPGTRPMSMCGSLNQLPSRRDDEVAQERQRRPQSHGTPFDRRDERLLEVEDAVDQPARLRGRDPGARAGGASGVLEHVLHVAAGAEHVTGAAQDHRGDVGPLLQVGHSRSISAWAAGWSVLRRSGLSIETVATGRRRRPSGTRSRPRALQDGDHAGGPVHLDHGALRDAERGVDERTRRTGARARG